MTQDTNKDIYFGYFDKEAEVFVELSDMAEHREDVATLKHDHIGFYFKATSVTLPNGDMLAQIISSNASKLSRDIAKAHNKVCEFFPHNENIVSAIVEGIFQTAKHFPAEQNGKPLFLGFRLNYEKVVYLTTGDTPEAPVYEYAFIAAITYANDPTDYHKNYEECLNNGIYGHVNVTALRCMQPG